MTDSTTSPLAAVLTELGWKPEGLARRLTSLAALHGRAEQVHAKTPYKWLLGTQPRSPWPALAAVLLSDELGRAITAAELGWHDGQIEAVSAISGLVLPWNVAGGLHALRVVTHAGSMDRRIALTLLGGAVCVPTHEWLLAPPDTAAVTRSSGSPLPVTAVDHLDNIVGQLRRIDDQLGGGTLLSLVRAHLQVVLNLLNERRYTDTVGRRLHAAHAAGDRALGAHIIGFMSEQAVDLGQLRESVTLAETARTGYPGATPRVAAILDLRAAMAHARAQASTDCRRALDTAFDRLGDTPSSSGEPDWCYWLNEADTHAQAGYCYLRLADWSRARHHLRAALRLQDPNYRRESARRHIELAETYLRQDQPDVHRGRPPRHRLPRWPPSQA